MRWQLWAIASASGKLRNQGTSCEHTRFTTPLHRFMATQDENPLTTNAEDQREVAKLQARLQNKRSSASSSSSLIRLPSVDIAEGAHKYVLIRASIHGEEQYIVTSRRGAPYHRDAAEPMIVKLEAAGYNDIEVTGGGRILFEQSTKKIKIFGFSYGFGQANHAISAQTVEADPRYKDFTVTTSNDGY